MTAPERPEPPPPPAGTGLPGEPWWAPLDLGDRALRLATWPGVLSKWLLRKRFPPLLSDEAARRASAAPRLSLPAPGDAPLATVVIPVYGKFATTWTCLEALAQTRHREPFEVLVVDDASPDETPQLVPRFPRVRYVRNEVNLGFGGTCNRGAELARGRFVCFLNNDTRVLDGFLDAALETLRARADVGAVGARLLFPDGRLQEAGGTLFRDATCFHFGRNRDPERPEFRHAREVDYCSAACLTVAREEFLAMGGFDPLYAPAYYEDADLCLRLWQRGRKVVYQPRSTVVHYEGVTNGRSETSGVRRFHDRNRGRFAARWAEELRASPAPGRRTVTSARRRCGPTLLVVGSGAPPLIDTLRESGFTMSALGEQPDREAQEAAGVEVLVPPYFPSLGAVLRGNGAGRFAALVVTDPVLLPEAVRRVRVDAPGLPLLFAIPGAAGHPTAAAACDAALAWTREDAAALAAAHPLLPRFGPLDEGAGALRGLGELLRGWRR